MGEFPTLAGCSSVEAFSVGQETLHPATTSERRARGVGGVMSKSTTPAAEWLVVAGPSIVKVDGTFDEKIFEGTTAAAFRSALMGKTLVSARRLGTRRWRSWKLP